MPLSGMGQAELRARVQDFLDEIRRLRAERDYDGLLKMFELPLVLVGDGRTEFLTLPQEIHEMSLRIEALSPAGTPPIWFQKIVEIHPLDLFLILVIADVHRVDSGGHPVEPQRMALVLRREGSRFTINTIVNSVELGLWKNS